MILNLMKKNPKPPVYTITVNITNGSYSGDTTVALGSTATGVVTPDTGYMLTGVTITTDAGAAVSVTFDTTTGLVTFTPQTALSGEGFTASGTCNPNLYAISTTVENGTYTGAISVFYGSSATVTIMPLSGYQLPSSISVTNATYTYDDTTGIITVTPTGAGTITISVSCEVIPVSGYDLTLNFIPHEYSSDDENALNFKINAVPSSDTDIDYCLTIPYAGYTGDFRKNGEIEDLVNLHYDEGGTYTIHNVTSVTYWADHSSIGANKIYINGTDVSNFAPVWASKQAITLYQNTTINIYYNYDY